MQADGGQGFADERLWKTPRIACAEGLDGQLHYAVDLVSKELDALLGMIEQLRTGALSLGAWQGGKVHLDNTGILNNLGDERSDMGTAKDMLL